MQFLRRCILISKVPNKYKVYPDYAELIINSPTYGEFKFEIDLDDLEKVKSYHWTLLVSKKYGYGDGKIKQYYASCVKNKILLHRFVMKAPKDKVVDHADQNTFNTRKSNLRLCNMSQNTHNAKIQSNNTSGYPGVFYNEHLVTPKWCAHIKVNYRNLNLGSYDTLEEALDARRKAELKYFGEFKSCAY